MRTRKLVLGFLACAALVLCSTVFVKNARADNTRLPILMYHNITQKCCQVGPYTVLAKTLENDLRFLKQNGFQTITMSELLDHLDNGAPLPEKPIMLTFDDGFESVYVYALPLLEKYDMTAVVAIVGAYTERFTQTEDHNLDYSYLTWPQVEDMYRSGRIELQNHTTNLHSTGGARQGSRIIPGETASGYTTVFTQDVGALQDSIFAHTGWRPNTFVYPYGFCCKESLPLLSDMGFRAGLTCQEIVNELPADGSKFFLLGRFNRGGNVSTETFLKRVLK